MGNGLLGGLSNAVNTGLNAYIQEKKYQDQKSQEAQANKLKNLGLIVEARKSGLLPQYDAQPEGEAPKPLGERNITGFEREQGYVDKDQLLKDLQIQKLNQDLGKGKEEAAQRQKGKQLSPKEVGDVNAFRDTVGALSELKEMVSKNDDLFGPVSGVIASNNPWNERAQLIQSKIDKVRQNVGKLLEGGVLRKEDEAKYRKILSVMSDTPEVALGKIELLLSDMGRDYSNYRSGLVGSGYDLTAFPASFSLPKAKNPLVNPKAVSPKAGSKDGDYTFMGGDPADPKNWVKK